MQEAQLDIGNIFTILRKAGDQRVSPPRDLVELLGTRLRGLQCKVEDISEKQVADALHGLRYFRDSEETRRLLEAMIPKVEQCLEKIHPVSLVGDSGDSSTSGRPEAGCGGHGTLPRGAGRALGLVGAR